MNINSFKPYIINAFYIWAIDTGLTPMIKVINNKKNSIPRFLKEKEIIFDIHPKSIKNLILGKDKITFQALINDKLETISININNLCSLIIKEHNYSIDFEIDTSPQFHFI